MHTDDQRSAGILIPAFATRHDGDFGIGDTTSLRHWIDWAARYNVGFIQLLPINEHGADESPYSAVSSIAIDPIYLALDPESIPWLSASDFSNPLSQAEPLRQASRVVYAKVREIKRNLLELAWARFDEAGPKLAEEFKQFKAAESKWLDDYCLFRYLMEIHGGLKTWDQWPKPFQDPEQARYEFEQMRKEGPAAVDYRIGFFAFLQWLCFRQWRSLRAHADQMGVKLMGDVPIGIAMHSCDVFFDRADFDTEWCGGSPAEDHHPHNPFIQQWGQNWGIPLYRWDQMQANGYQWWHRRIKRLTEVFRMFRLDHILGFYRIYAFPWAPKDNHLFVNLSHDEVAQITHGRFPRWWERPDDTPENCQANRDDGDDRLKAVLGAVTDQEVIAEDLGWVPYYVRPHLAELGIARFKIPHWDCEPSGHPTPPADFPTNSFATYSTHDHDPINAVWKACDRAIEHHRQHPNEDTCRQAEDARQTLRILCQFADIELGGNQAPPTFSESVRLRLIKALMSSSSRYVSFVITELFNLDERINEPGLHSLLNWSFRIPWTVSQIETTPELQDVCHKLSIAISITQRNQASGFSSSE